MEATLHTPETAPEAAKPLLDASQKAFGMIPNLHAAMAESPETLKSYQVLSELFGATSLTATERDVVWLTVARENACHYCVPAHTWIAKSNKTDDAIIEALRAGSPLADTRLEALRVYAVELTVNRGQASESATRAFFDAGFTKQQALEVVLGVTHKTLSNYVNHVFDVPVDAAFAAYK